MRHDVVVFVNGRRHRVPPAMAFGPLAYFLRDVCGLVGTKVGCGEGDCGACTVLVGRPFSGAIRYRTATSCLLTPCLVDGAHVVTIEGLRRDGSPTPVQEATVDHHGSQCGYCTPGIVMALSGLFESTADPDAAALTESLTGNLCRCTGYLPILDAGRAAASAGVPRLAESYAERPLIGELERLSIEPVRIESDDGRTFFRPDRAEGAVAFKAENPGAVVVAGGTDLGVWKLRRGYDPPVLLSLAGVSEWTHVTLEGDAVSIGANVTWTDLAEFAARDEPGLVPVTRLFASPQVRNVATFVGNVAHGSPISDAVGFLHVAGASLDLVGPRGTRSVPIVEFFTGYRRTVLAPDELIARAVVPIPGADEHVRLYKVSKRKEMDISTFRAAVRVREDAGRIARAAIAYAGVGPKVLRLPETEAFLAGRPFDEATFREAGRVARGEIEPISDVRGSRDFRLILAENVLLRFYFDCAGIDVEEAIHAG
ncbi:MAG TPA: FAD binding domain-containing protein [Isosphaeraceae bacterium]|jgi:xanthine dehydrogenase small subunit